MAEPHKGKQGAPPGPEPAFSPQLGDSAAFPKDESNRPGFKPQLHQALGHMLPEQDSPLCLSLIARKWGYL